MVALPSNSHHACYTISPVYPQATGQSSTLVRDKFRNVLNSLFPKTFPANVTSSQKLVWGVPTTSKLPKS
jgi:hypothetical protein